MKNGVSTNELQEALARVEAARQARTNAGRRLKRAEDAVRTAATDVAAADEEMKSASAHLDQAIKKGLSAALKKGGPDISIAMAEIIARSLGGDAGGAQEPGGQEPAGEEPRGQEPGGRPATPEAVSQEKALVGDADADDADDGAGNAGQRQPTLLDDAA